MYTGRQGLNNIICLLLYSLLPLLTIFDNQSLKTQVPYSILKLFNSNIFIGILDCNVLAVKHLANF